MRDKFKPVRWALEAQYALIAEAQKNEDINALRSLRTSDFTAKMPSGETVDGKRVDPSKPYDPDAPPYNPEANTPKK